MIEQACMRWLRYEKRCLFIVNERSPLYNGGQPDVLGVTHSRYAIEIEVKRSVSDFRANAKKRCVITRDTLIHRWPKKYYFAAPPHVVKKIQFEIPEWAGLLEVDRGVVKVVIESPMNSKSKRLSVKQCVKLAECMANQIAADAVGAIGDSCPCRMDDFHSVSWNGRKKDYTNYQI